MTVQTEDLSVHRSSLRASDARKIIVCRLTPVRGAHGWGKRLGQKWRSARSLRETLRNLPATIREKLARPTFRC